jgi:hypothetical protein
MPESNEKTASAWRDAIEQALFDTKEDDIVIPYFQISFAFPGGPHSQSVDVQRIDWDTLTPWAEKLGWHVRSAPEATPEELEFIPHIRFMRIDHK